MSELDKTIRQVKAPSAFRRKKEIQTPARFFFGHPPSLLDPIGDDAAVIQNGDDYLLMSCDGVIPELVASEPKWAGYCSVLVSVSDIYAMGGRPVAIVNLLSAPTDERAALIAEGMAEGCRKFGVPMVGGHYLPGEAEGAATAILGRATHLLRGSQGRPGQLLIAAVDLNGSPYKHYLQWDCTSNKTAEELHNRLELLPKIAELGLASAARDISNAGVLGTLAMLAENAKCGADIDLGRIPRPPGADFQRWLLMFPGYGFVLSTDPEHADDVRSMFESEGVTAAVVGELTPHAKVMVYQGAESAELMDWTHESLVVARHEQADCGSRAVQSGS